MYGDLDKGKYNAILCARCECMGMEYMGISMLLHLGSMLLSLTVFKYTHPPDVFELACLLCGKQRHE